MKNSQKRMLSMHRMNQAIMLTYSILSIVLFLAYVLEYMKGARTLQYTLIFSVLDLVPYLMCVLAYRRNKASKYIKYIMGVGFSFLYTYVLLTANVSTTFVYTFIMFLIAMPYGDIVLCYVIGGFSVTANVVAVIIGFSNGSLTIDDLALVEVQVLSVLLAALFMGIATNTIGKINAQRMMEINEEKDKSDALLANTLEISKGISGDIEAVTESMSQKLYYTNERFDAGCGVWCK